MKQTVAQIYKAEARGKSEDEAFKRLSVFNFDDYQDASRKPFGNLLALNEETLGPKHKVFRHVEANTEIIIIPLAGALLYTDSLGNEDIIETEQIRVFSANDGMSYTLENPYVEDLINYLQIWIKPEKNTDSISQQQKFGYPGKNTLFPIFSSNGPEDSAIKIRQQAYGFLGIFEAKNNGTYTMGNPENGLFVFVVNGTFEFENRVIEKKDGLSLLEIESATFESLSENALLLLMEIPQ